MNTTYSDVVFNDRQPDTMTAIKLNLLRDELSSALASIGGYYTDTWKWTTKTADASVSGNVGINATSWAAATFLNISEFSAAGTDKTIQMDKVIASGNAVLVKDASNANNYAEYTFTGAGTDMGTWRQYPVTVVTGKYGGLTPNNNQNTTLTIFVQGATGGGGGTGDMTKAVYDTNNNGVVDTCDSLPWTSVTGRPTTYPPDSTAMLKSVYDTNGDGISDHAALADAAPWTGITGKPSVFPPDNTAMLKSVYDTNANNKVDSAESADTAPWTGISGKPASFTPAAHAVTHLDNGSDPVPIVTTSRTGLAPVLNGNAATYLNGIGTYTAVSGSVNPGTWTTLTLSSGWTVKVTPQYRVEVNGAVSTVYFRGAVTQASGAAALAFILPGGAWPSAVRMLMVAGLQTEGQTLYHAQIDTAGNVTITPVVRAVFTWPVTSTAQDVYLDSMSFSL